MSRLEERYEELIQREIDGEISEHEKTALREYAAANENARSLKADLAKLTEVLNQVDAVDPPADLAESIVAALPQRRSTSPSVFRPRSWIAGSSVLKYGYVFAAGLILGLALHQFVFNQASAPPAADVQGSMIPLVPGEQLRLNPSGLSGSVNLRMSGTAGSIEFDLDSQVPVQFEIEFSSEQVGFRGFRQQSNKVNSFAAGPGLVIVQCEGKQRFTLLVENLKSIETNLSVGVFISGEIVQRGSLRLPGSG